MKTNTSYSIPLWLKLTYTAFMALLIPVYWHHYGPTNFLYFCDIALLLTLAGIWVESPLLISLPAVGILLPQVLWCVDYAVQLCGFKMTGMTAYMFDGNKPLFLRGLSLFHGWLPLLLVFLVFRLGYDKRALKGWTALATGLCLVAFFWLPKAGARLSDPNLPRNVNYVFGMDDAQPQTWTIPELYLMTWLALLIFVVFVPTHFVLKKICPTPEQAAAKRV
ncbi:MAG: hypothetical protein B7Z37_00485 [Verrucomicrobia bacterium 12-59-8]|nr:MAG: hypothetical protein B7Z37_00485 [Verrucomicrobia bacterium 12-59-8]